MGYIRTAHGYFFSVCDKLGSRNEVDEFRFGKDLAGVIYSQSVQQVEQYYHYEEYETYEYEPADVRIGRKRQITRFELARDHYESFEDRHVGFLEVITLEEHVKGEAEREDEEDVESQTASEVHRHGFEHLDIGGHSWMLGHQTDQLPGGEYGGQGSQSWTGTQDQTQSQEDQGQLQPVFWTGYVVHWRGYELQ